MTMDLEPPPSPVGVTVTDGETESDRSGPRGGVTAVAIAAVAASWLILRPYLGVIHDAQLYFHTALFGREPSFLAHDVMLANDRQMDRSVFVPLIRPFVDAFGMAGTALVIGALGLVGWVVALAGLGRAILGRSWWMLVVAVPAFGAYWGPLFMIAEPFATPRVIAEALVVGGVALALTRRTIVPIALCGLAMVLHPIIGLSGVAVIAVLVVWERRRWAAALAIVGAAGVLVAAWDPLTLAGTDGFSGPWLAVIAERASLVLPGEWHLLGWARTLFGFVIVGSLWATARSDRVRRLAGATTIAAGAGMVAAIAFSWIWIRPFVTQLQPWRMLWILHLVAIVAIVWFTREAWRERSDEHVLRALAAWLLALTVGVRSAPVVFMIATLLLLPVLAPIRFPFQERLVRPRSVRVLGAIVATIAVLEILLVAITGGFDGGLGGIPWIGIASQFPAVTVLVAAFVIVAALAAMGSLPGGAFVRVIGVFALGATVALGVVTWDHRTPFASYVESLETPVIELPADAVVLVEHDSIATATLFRRPTYYSGFAGAGVVFSEQLARTYDHHAELARSIGVPFALNYRLDDIAAVDWTAPDVGALERMCADPDGPTHVFLRRRSPSLDGVVWSSPVPVGDVPDDVANRVILDDAFALYACQDVLG